MTRKLSQFKGLIPFVALPLFWGCSEDPLGPQDPLPNPPIFQDVEEGTLHLMIDPGEADLEVGDRLELRRVWYDGEDIVEDPGKVVNWVVEDPDIAAVSEDGLLQALAEGTTRIFAESEGAHSQLMIRVRQS